VSQGQTSLLDRALGSDPYVDHVGARLLEFFASTSPWQRRLWDSGTVLALRELHEASEWTARKTLSTGATAWFARDVERLSGRDRGIGDKALRQQLTTTLRSPLIFASRNHRQLLELTDMIDSEYIPRWSHSLVTSSPPAAERLSRAMASHLLDRGFAMGHLHRWARGHRDASSTLGELLDDASSLARTVSREFEVLVPFTSVPRQGDLAHHLPSWLSATDVARRLAMHPSAPLPLRQGGGFVFTLDALDPHAAAAAAARIVERMIARSGYARSLRGGTLEPEGRAWVCDSDVVVPLRAPARGAFVLSLVSERQLYAATARTSLDDALELATPLNHGPAGPAVSGGWAAIEALLVEPRDAGDATEGRGAVAADRLAALVAASWPRSELTALSYKHEPPSPDALSTTLASCQTNRERSVAVARALGRYTPLALDSVADRAAESRMRGLVASPRSTLRDVRAHVMTTTRRLYRQRNIIMHGGATNALALDVTLRTAAPLVGAGLDRITHAWFRDQTDPLALAQRADVRLALVGTTDGRDLTDLLE